MLSFQPSIPAQISAVVDTCHPHPGRTNHPNGICHCQRSPSGRRPFLDQLVEAGLGEWEPISPHERHKIADAAAALHMQADVQSPLAPWVVTGTIDGHAFHLRERSGIYVLRLAAEPDRPDEGAVGDTEIKAGLVDDLSGENGPDNTIALHFIAATTRTHLRRASCPHPHQSGDRYCPACGTPLVDPAEP